MLEDEFGDIKEPKYVMQFLFFIWVISGAIVLYFELRKYVKNMSRKRETVDYSKNIKKFFN